MTQKTRAPHPLAIVLSLLFACNVDADPADDPALICDRAIEKIASETAVPIDVLRAVARVDSVRPRTEMLKPWPWTVNMEGRAVWFDTAEQAQVFVFRHFMTGARSFDIGCFQINYRWHAQAFSSIEEMFDPLINARFAAEFLVALKTELGDWPQATGAFHSKAHKHTQQHIRDRKAPPHSDLVSHTANFGSVLSQTRAHRILNATNPLSPGSDGDLLNASTAN
ncbi:MAG: lytic transglycosylase domain-containing protein [Pseudomonadota bacterium]